LHDRIPKKVEKPILAQRKVAGYAKKVCGKQTNAQLFPQLLSLSGITGQMIST
jgi:hypothetical protein